MSWYRSLLLCQKSKLPTDRNTANNDPQTIPAMMMTALLLGAFAAMEENQKRKMDALLVPAFVDHWKDFGFFLFFFILVISIDNTNFNIEKN